MSEFSHVQLQQLDEFLNRCIAEDFVDGDVTTTGMFGFQTPSTRATILAKAEGIVAGLPIVERCFRRVDDKIRFRALKPEGAAVRPGDVVCDMEGATGNLLTGERLALNLLCHLSGIATLTRQYVKAAEGYPVKILDTRKTLPGLRFLEKYAVRQGGGENHRVNLYDTAMIKDNHIVVARRLLPGMTFADMVRKIKQYKNVPVILEIDSLDQVQAARISGAEIILLDNFTPEQLRKAVEQFKGSGVQLEASGGVTLKTVGEIAATGVHRISIGALTHSAPALDFSMNFEA